MDQKKLFHVIVLGGIGLAVPAVVTACSSSTDSSATPPDAAVDAGRGDAYYFPDEGARDVFPHEGDVGPVPDAPDDAPDATDAAVSDADSGQDGDAG